MTDHKTAGWPWEWGGEKHKAILTERQELLSSKLAGAMDEDEWYRLSCIRGVLDAIEEARDEAHYREQEDAERNGTQMP